MGRDNVWINDRARDLLKLLTETVLSEKDSRLYSNLSSCYERKSNTMKIMQIRKNDLNVCHRSLYLILYN